MPTTELADGGCGWTEEAFFVAQAPAVFSGRATGLGEPGTRPDALGRIVELEVTEVYVDDSGQLEPGQAVRVFDRDAEIWNGYRVAVPSVDVERVMARDTVTVFGALNDDGFVRPWRVFSDTDDGLSMNGLCDHELDIFADIADHVGSPDALTMFVEFAEANARGEGITALRDAFEQWRADIDVASTPPAWQDQDPATRQLDPQTIPADLLPSLDVVGVSYALDDLGGADAVGVRTESGVSWSLISANVLPFVGPLYFLRGVDETVEVFVQRASTGAEAHVAGTV
ncbi:MAG: hypothetical protein ACLGHQ_13705, partial [Acidimicrobiia bacterium]